MRHLLYTNFKIQNKMKINQLFLFLFVLYLFPIQGFCQEKDENDKEFEEIRKNIPLGDVQELETDIEFPVGGIVIKSTSENAVKGIFRYKKERWKPEIDFRKEEGMGYLKIEADREGKLRKHNRSDENLWGIMLSRDVDHVIDLELGAGKCKVDLEGCRVKEFEFSMGAGEAKINLRNTSLRELEVDAAVGEATVDLSGEWKNDLDAEIAGGMGEITLILPADVGAKVDVSGILGEKRLPGFKKREGSYVNEQYGKTEHTLYIDITGGIGSVHIETRE